MTWHPGAMSPPENRENADAQTLRRPTGFSRGGRLSGFRYRRSGVGAATDSILYNLCMSTTALYKALVDAGANEELAERAVENLPPVSELVTTAELAALEIRLLRWNLILTGVTIAAIGLLIKL